MHVFDLPTYMKLSKVIESLMVSYRSGKKSGPVNVLVVFFGDQLFPLRSGLAHSDIERRKCGER